MLAAIFRIVALVRKELLAMLKDPRGRAVLFVPPVLQCIVFGYVVNYDLTRVAYIAFDRDRSAASSELLASLDGSGVFQRVANLERAADVKTMIDERRALVAVQIDQDFERRLLSGQSADVQVIADGRNSNTAGTALNYVRTVVDSFNAKWWAAHGGGGPPVRVTTRTWYNENLVDRWSIIPGLIGTLTLPEMLLMTAMGVAREKEEGTFDQLLVTPFRPAELMIGKALPSLLVFLSQATVFLLVAQLWFRIPFAGSFLTLYLGLTLFLLAVTGIGLLLSSLVGTMQQALLLCFLLAMPLMLLSGVFTSPTSMPEAIQDFDLINPLRYMIDISRRVYLEGIGRRSADVRFMAVGRDGSADAFDRRLGVQPAVGMKTENFWTRSLNSNLLDFIERDLVVGAVVELGGTQALVGGHGLSVFERAAIVEIGGDPHCAKGMIADRRGNARRPAHGAAACARRRIASSRDRSERRCAGRQEGKRRVFVLSVLGEIEVDAANEVPGRMPTFEKLMHGELGCRQFGIEGRIDFLPQAGQKTSCQVFCAGHWRNREGHLLKLPVRW